MKKILFFLAFAITVNAQEFTLENDVAKVTFSNVNATIEKVELKNHRPIKTKDWSGSDKLELDKPLPVLRAFNAGGASHNWLYGTMVFEGAWQATSTQSTISFRNKNNTLSMEVKHELLEKSSKIKTYCSIENVSNKDIDFKIALCAINGIHQDLGSADGRYAGIYEYSNSDKKLVSLGIEDSSEDIASEECHDITNSKYIALRSRFFATFWEFTGFKLSDVKEVVKKTTEGPSVTTGPMVTKGPSVLSESSTETLDPITVKAVVKTFSRLRDSAAEKQAMISIIWVHKGKKGMILKSGQEAKLNWQTTVSGLTKADLELLSEEEKKMEYSDGFYRFFRLLSSIMTGLLSLIYSVFAFIGLTSWGYGLSIITMTLLIKLAMHKMTVKQQKSMMMMQKVGPELKILQAKYKNNRQELAKKQMELWKKHGINPLGGCLPMLLQMPIFIALYQSFSLAANFRGQSFLWINDLSLPDYTFFLHFDWPLFGSPATLNILPIIYIAASLWMSFSMKTTNKNEATEGSEKTQQDMQKMMRWMPAVIGIIFYNMPAGLVLYFVTSTIVSSIETRRVRAQLGMS